MENSVMVIWLIILSIVLILSTVTIAKNWEMFWTILKGITFIIIGAVGYWIFTEDKHSKYFDNLAKKWFEV